MHSELILAFVVKQSPQIREHPKSLYDRRVHTYSSLVKQLLFISLWEGLLR